MKICNCCGRRLPLYCFHKDAKAKDGCRPRCQSCRNEVKREQEARKQKIKVKARFKTETDYLEHIQRKKELEVYRQENKFITKWNLKVPWEKTFGYIRDRCGTGRDSAYENVRNYITCRELKILWYRDRAYELKRPSIDRIDSTKDYTFENCRYIELSDNVRQARIGELKVGKIHWNKNGKFTSKVDKR